MIQAAGREEPAALPAAAVEGAWEIHSPSSPEAAAAWQELKISCSDSPLLDWQFFCSLLNYFGDGREIVAVYRTGDDVLAAGIFHRVRPLMWQTFQPSQAPIGAWLSRSQLPIATLVRGLIPSLPAACAVVGITQQDPDVVGRPTDNTRLRTSDYIRTARLTIAGSFSDYWSARGRNLRQNLRRQRNKLKRDGINPRLRIVTEPEALGVAVDAYGEMESRGWKASEGTNLHPSNAQGRFYRELLVDYAHSGEAIAFQYWYDDDLVSVDLCLQRGGVLTILKTTHDESQQGTSPAMLMRQEVFERLFDGGGTKRVEFYGKLMEWHTRWTSEVRQMYHVTCFRWSWLAALAEHRSSRAAAGRSRPAEVDAGTE